MTTPFPPHKVIGNIYYVGKRAWRCSWSSAPATSISNAYERNVPIIQKSIEQLGFKFSITRKSCSAAAHGDPEPMRW